jgi:hypothetical protein
VGQGGPGFEDWAAGVRFDDRKKRWINPDGTPWSPKDAPASTEPEFAFANYLRRVVETDKELRDSTRELYERNIRVHIGGTPLAKADIRQVTPRQLSDFCSSLKIGNGALRNVHQLISKAFTRAVTVGDIDVSPLIIRDRFSHPLRRAPAGLREIVVPHNRDPRLATFVNKPRAGALEAKQFNVALQGFAVLPVLLFREERVGVDPYGDLPGMVRGFNEHLGADQCFGFFVASGERKRIDTRNPACPLKGLERRFSRRDGRCDGGRRFVGQRL